MVSDATVRTVHGPLDQVSGGFGRRRGYERGSAVVEKTCNNYGKLTYLVMLTDGGLHKTPHPRQSNTVHLPDLT